MPSTRSSRRIKEANSKATIETKSKLNKTKKSVTKKTSSTLKQKASRISKSSVNSSQDENTNINNRRRSKRNLVEEESIDESIGQGIESDIDNAEDEVPSTPISKVSGRKKSSVPSSMVTPKSTNSKSSSSNKNRSKGKSKTRSRSSGGGGGGKGKSSNQSLYKFLISEGRSRRFNSLDTVRRLSNYGPSSEISDFDSAISSRMKAKTNELIDTYADNRSEAIVSILNCLFGFAGCGEIGQDDFTHDEPEEIVKSLLAESEESTSRVKKTALLLDSGKTSFDTASDKQLDSGFKTSWSSESSLVGNHGAFSVFWKYFFETANEIEGDMYQDDYFVPTLISWLSTFTNAKYRPLRYVGAIFGFHLVSACVSGCTSLGERIEEDGTGSLSSAITALKESIFKFWNQCMVFFYRDISADIRVESMRALSCWIIHYDTVFLNDKYLKYLGWNLHDQHPAVRLACLQGLTSLYSVERFAPKLELFSARFRPRMVQLTNDVDDIVVAAAVRLCTVMVVYDASQFTTEDLEQIYALVGAASPIVRSAAGYFTRRALIDGTIQAEIEANKEGDADRIMLCALIDFLREHTPIPDQPEVLVDALWGLAPCLYNFPKILELVMDPAPESDDDLDRLPVADRPILIELAAAVVRGLCGEPIISSEDDDIQAEDIKAIDEARNRVLLQLEFYEEEASGHPSQAELSLPRRPSSYGLEQISEQRAAFTNEFVPRLAAVLDSYSSDPDVQGSVGRIIICFDTASAAESAVEIAGLSEEIASALKINVTYDDIAVLAEALVKLDACLSSAGAGQEEANASRVSQLYFDLSESFLESALGWSATDSDEDHLTAGSSANGGSTEVEELQACIARLAALARMHSASRLGAQAVADSESEDGVKFIRMMRSLARAGALRRVDLKSDRVQYARATETKTIRLLCLSYLSWTYISDFTEYVKGGCADDERLGALFGARDELIDCWSSLFSSGPLFYNVELRDIADDQVEGFGSAVLQWHVLKTALTPLTFVLGPAPCEHYASSYAAESEEGQRLARLCGIKILTPLMDSYGSSVDLMIDSIESTDEASLTLFDVHRGALELFVHCLYSSWTDHTVIAHHALIHVRDSVSVQVRTRIRSLLRSLTKRWPESEAGFILGSLKHYYEAFKSVVDDADAEKTYYTHLKQLAEYFSRKIGGRTERSTLRQLITQGIRYGLDYCPTNLLFFEDGLAPFASQLVPSEATAVLKYLESVLIERGLQEEQDAADWEPYYVLVRVLEARSQSTPVKTPPPAGSMATTPGSMTSSMSDKKRKFGKLNFDEEAEEEGEDPVTSPSPAKRAKSSHSGRILRPLKRSSTEMNDPIQDSDESGHTVDDQTQEDDTQNSSPQWRSSKRLRSHK